MTHDDPVWLCEVCSELLIKISLVFMPFEMSYTVLVVHLLNLKISLSTGDRSSNPLTPFKPMVYF